MERILNMRPPRIAMGLLGISAVLGIFSPHNTVLYLPYKLVGSISLSTGFIFMMWAWLQFKRANTAICPTADTSILIKSGMYRYSRNPMYLGLLLILMGAAFFTGSITAFLSPVAFFIIIDKVFIPFEEVKLTDSYGTHYSDYLKRTRRWI